jgi:acetyl-CoA carboxylase, biotin carboxylase subunit
VLVKAASGGGGRGMKVYMMRRELPGLMQAQASEAKAAFGDDTVYIEKYLASRATSNSRCSATARAAPFIWASATARFSAATRRCWRKPPHRSLNADQRARMGEIVRQAMAGMGYRGAGTIEFLWEDGEFYFIEMNTRMQVEHPVTEADDRPRSGARTDPHCRWPCRCRSRRRIWSFEGHAIECRINAEDPATFAPHPVW